MIDDVINEAAATSFRDALIEDDPSDLYEHAPCGYVSILPTGRVVKANQTFLHWTGYRAADLTGMRIHDLLAPGDRIFYETHFAPSLALQGSVREIAVELRCADGRRLPVLLNAILVADALGAPSAVRLAVFDARERRAYESELLTARRQAEAAAERARTLAETLQQTLLPPSLPVIPGLEIGGAFRPAGDGSEIGGDFYDAFETPTGAWGVVIGDVCGKGACAAVLTALARYTIRAGAVRTTSPARVLAALHDALVLDATDGFVTAVYLTASVEATGVRLDVSVGGHHLPLLVDHDGSLRTVGRTGHLLGMLGPPRLHDTQTLLRAGQTVVLFTDGVLEARHGDEFYGEHRLHGLLAEHAGTGAQELADIVASAAIEFQHGSPRDDIAVVTLRAPG